MENDSIIEMKSDNQGAIILIKNTQLTNRSKHIDIVYYHIRDLKEKGKIDISYIPINEMVADGLTKLLAKNVFKRFIKILGITKKGKNH